MDTYIKYMQNTYGYHIWIQIKGMGYGIQFAMLIISIFLHCKKFALPYPTIKTGYLFCLFVTLRSPGLCVPGVVFSTVGKLSMRKDTVHGLCFMAFGLTMGNQISKFFYE